MPLEGGRFRVGAETEVRFEGDVRRRRALIVRTAAEPVTFTRAHTAALTPAQLAEYAGDYRSDEVEATYSWKVEKGERRGALSEAERYYTTSTGVKEPTRATMSVASHLGIAVREYDRRIRTFIPNYAEMLAEAASALDASARTIVDLGVGTGALSARCLQQAPAARVIGIDADTEMLPLARRRLGRRAILKHGNFLRAALPPADAVVASLALHHVRTRPAKARLYARIRAALRPGGVLVSGDCHPSERRHRWLAQRELWLQHLHRTYTPRQAEQLLRDWSHEDVYVPLRTEVALLEQAGFATVDVVWRRGAFAVIAASA